MNILCSILGHQFNQLGDDDHGNCMIRSSCVRCGYVSYQKLASAHDFDPATHKIWYVCNPNGKPYVSDHRCIQKESIVCKTCGFIMYTENSCFEYKYPQKQGCIETRECPGCHQKFELFKNWHSYKATGEFSGEKDGCRQDFICSKCGDKARYDHGKLLKHEWTDFTVVSTCWSYRSCQRCGFRETIEGHDWQPTGETMNHKDGQVAGGDYYSWDEVEQCSICAATRLRSRIHYPPF